MQLGENVYIDNISDEIENGNVGSKTRSLRLILGKKNCVWFRHHIVSLMLLKLGQNVCLNVISNEFENRSCLVKNYVTRSNRRKTYVLEATFSIFMKVFLPHSLEGSGE